MDLENTVQGNTMLLHEKQCRNDITRGNVFISCAKFRLSFVQFLNVSFRPLKLRVRACVFAALVIPLLVHADPTDPGDRRPLNMELSASLNGIENIDPRNGNLIVRHKDLVVPGNGGMDIVVWRSYSLNQMSAGLLATHNQSFRWTALGPGWTLGVAPLVQFENTYQVITGGYIYDEPPLITLCKTQSYLGTNMTTSLVLPDGDVHPLSYGTGGNALLTKSGWRLTCVANNVVVTSPEGTRYDYGNIAADRRIGREAVSYRDSMYVTPGHPFPIRLLNRTMSFMVAKTATDVNNNQLQFQYQNFGTPIVPWPLPGNYNGSGDLSTSLIDADSIERPSVLLSSVTSSDGRAVNFSYDAQTGRLQSMSDSAGRTWSYQYLALDALNSRTLSTVILPTGLTWRYSYAPGEFLNTRLLSVTPGPIEPLNSETAASRKLIGIQYPTGGSVMYGYDYYYNLNSAGLGQFYSAGERVNRRTLSTGESWSYNYTRGGSGQYDMTQVTGPEGTTTYQFVGAGYAIWTDGYPHPFQNNAWRIGQIIRKTDPTGGVEQYVWQARELVNKPYTITELGYVFDERMWAADLQQRTIIRDGATYTTTYSNYDSFGNPGTIVEAGTNGGNRTTTRTYLNDTGRWILGRLKDEMFAGGVITRTFDASGQLATLARDGIMTSFTYDNQGNVATKTLPRGLVYSYANYKHGVAQTEYQPEGTTITRVVDNAGNVTSETNGENRTTNISYDGLNRVTFLAYPSGNPKTITYTATIKTATRGGLSEETVYDGFGRPASIALGGIVKSFAYDGQGRKIFESDPAASSGTSYQYDALGRVTRITNADGFYQVHVYGAGTKSITDERGQTTTLSYRAYGEPGQQYLMSVTTPQNAANVAVARNARDLISSVTQAGLTRDYGYNGNYYLTSISNPETGMTLLGRDEAGNMTSRKVGSSGTTSFVYDGQNRLQSVSYPDNTPSINYSYSKTGKMLLAASATGNRSFGYDNNDNLINETLVVDGRSFAASYIYNENDQLSAITYPHSRRRVDYLPDALGRPTRISGYVSNISYWPSGQVQQINYANGTVTGYSQNARLWPSSFSTRNKAGAAYLNLSYSYDGAGNLTSISDTVDGGYNRALEYDGINRLTSIAGPWGAGTISYDGRGNINTQNVGSAQLSYNYDGNNRLSNVSGSRSSAFSYDAYGNIAGGNGRSYSYDGAVNLRCIDCGNASKIEYAYDAINHRAVVVKAGTKSYEMYGSSGNQLIEFTPGQPNKLVEYIYLGNRRLAQRVSQ